MEETLALFAYGDTGWGDELLSGLWVTIKLSVVTLPFGLALGLILAGMKLSSSITLQWLANGYTTFFRGIPELLTLFLIYHGVGALLNKIYQAFGGDYVELDTFTAGVVALSMVFASFASEVFRGGFQAIPIGQTEAARAIGMSGWQAFHRVQLPQVWRFALPGLGNLFMILMKDTALVSIIALDELLRKTQIAVGATKLPFTFFSVTCLIYLILAMFGSIALVYLERRANRGIRRV
jgi:polar amino acid transport system permease protein